MVFIGHNHCWPLDIKTDIGGQSVNYMFRDPLINYRGCKNQTMCEGKVNFNKKAPLHKEVCLAFD